MWNVVEEPWLLLFVALISLGVVVLFREGPSGPPRRWPLLIPLAIALLAFGLDRFIQTDRERLEATLNRALRFAKTHDFSDFNDIFAPDYSDAFHATRADLRRRCESSLAIADIERISKRRLQWTIETSTAQCDLSVLVRLRGRQGSYAGSQGLYFVEVRMRFDKQPDGRWLIRTVELVSLNNQQFDWGGVP